MGKLSWGFPKKVSSSHDFVNISEIDSPLTIKCHKKQMVIFGLWGKQENIFVTSIVFLTLKYSKVTPILNKPLKLSISIDFLKNIKPI